MRRRDFLSAVAAAGVRPGQALALARPVAPPVAAFVMGCDRFDHLPRLATPGADARAVAARLIALGHDVSLHLNLTRDALLLALARFRVRAAAAKTVAFYLATHGVQRAGRVHLAPTDGGHGGGARLSGFVPLQAFVWAVSDRIRTKIIFVDACREIAGPPGGADPGAGFDDQAAGAGLHLLYASQFGAPAFDGDGRHGPFAAALLEGLNRPGLTVEQLSRFIRLHVARATGGLQVPWSRSSLLREVRLSP